MGTMVREKFTEATTRGVRKNIKCFPKKPEENATLGRRKCVWKEGDCEEF